MRDPARIDRMIELLREAWHKEPDQRLGQLVTNLSNSTAPWCVEDGEMERLIRTFLDGGWPAILEAHR
jgi:uncharacterized protein YihD (DUF1040 family)